MEDIFSKEFLQATKTQEKIIKDKIEQKEKVEEKKQEPVVEQKPISVAKPQTNSVVEKKQTLTEAFLTKVVEYAETSGEQLDARTKTFAVDIITAANKRVVSEDLKWNMIDVNGCGLVSQIKRWAKLGVTAEDKLYVDIRNNSKTGLKDIAIKPQYQTIEKLIVKYYKKGLQVVRFKEDVICIGDEVEYEEDFETGLDMITKHVRNTKIDRNKLDNIEGAYKIIYIRDSDNKLNHYVVKIDKNRIMRAYNASSSKEKTVWNLDTRKMVLKTVTWEMWNDKNIRAFMEFPDEIINDINVVEENEEMDWSKETNTKSVEQAQEKAKVNVATGEVIDVTYD